MNNTLQSRLGPRAARRQAVSGDGADLVRWSSLFGEGDLPALVEPAMPGLSLAHWAHENQALIHQRLVERGAILFRGFPVASPADFNACIDGVSGGALEYKFRASPRTQIQKDLNVYTSTDYPAQESIFPHNEHSYSPVLPLHLFFYCEIAALTEGETPIGSTRLLLGRIDPAVREALARRKIMYVRNFGEGFGLPWQTVFQTSDKAEVEAYCKGVGIVPEWRSGDRLRTRQIGPALMRHPKTGEAVWCNHGTFFHELSLPASAREQLRSEFAPEDLPQNTFYGDGAPIEPDAIRHLQGLYLDVMVKFPWQRGDVLMVDNLLCLHGRSPYTGPRRVLVAMAHACRSQDLDVAGESA
ncbi:TauD/TfdA family dioxygenase [Paracidovorax anthurii]|uniref:Alpha-ketoglutarate-dependent taurine dioxygenase n=1 Tax=Paracidovorax anthurii TaxID=78229 RepID=A0A328YPL8_9BURK|nr:TauD/TfdA family dioxygenase [Paracidovorax anthurii]RAR75304.1 alpha-ketoglutarate-dependent taurine dioxygenase [Paracidovorax anthurii]